MGWKNKQGSEWYKHIADFENLLSQGNLLSWDISYLKTESICSISDSERYKMIGNGWCKDNIKRFFAVALANTDTSEQIICQSFYDGIATARLILDDLGFNNIKYTAYEVDKYAMKVATSNYPDINEAGDAFGVREDTWQC